MAQEFDVQMAEALCDALAGKQVGAAEGLLGVGSLLHVPGRSGLAGQYQGGVAILGLARRMADLTSGTLHFSSSSALTADDQPIVLFGRVNATRYGARLDTDVVYVFTLRNGEIREIRILHENQDHVDRFWTA